MIMTLCFCSHCILIFVSRGFPASLSVSVKMPGFSLKRARLLCLQGAISPSTYLQVKKFKKDAHVPLHKKKLFDLNKYSDRESELMFRFTPAEVRRIAKAMGIPTTIKLSNRMKLSGIEAFAILLRRLCYPNRLCDMAKIFGRDTSALSRICDWMTNWIYSKFLKCIKTLKQKWLSKEKWNEFAEVCSAQGSVYSNIVGFIDGTCRPICRPSENQEQYYSGYYKEHVNKYQGVMLPNGIIGRIDGPFKGRRHDSAIIHFSGILSEMQKLFVNDDGSWFSLYGDAGYANQKFVKVGFKNFKRLSDQ